MTLSPGKTKLLVWFPANQKRQPELLKLFCPISIDKLDIDYSTSAEHVGVTRSTDGSNILFNLVLSTSYSFVNSNHALT